MKKRESKEVKQEIVKEAKENEELYQFIKSLTKEEIVRIKDTRKFNEIKPKTPTWNVAVLCDTIRFNIRQVRSKIEKRLINIDDLSSQISRLKVQLTTGITEEIKPGMRMTENELKSYIQTNDWTRTGEVDAIPMALAEMRGFVGHMDVAQQIVMTSEAFDQFVNMVDVRLKKKGYNMFKELE